MCERCSSVFGGGGHLTLFIFSTTLGRNSPVLAWILTSAISSREPELDAGVLFNQIIFPVFRGIGGVGLGLRAPLLLFRVLGRPAVLFWSMGWCLAAWMGGGLRIPVVS